MGVNADDMTGAERPRSRRLVSVLAVLVPVVVLAGGAAWFVRSYVMPPMAAISAPLTMSLAAVTRPEAPTRLPAEPAPETTGRVAPAAAPVWPEPPRAAAPSSAATRSAASVWDSVPLPGPPRQALTPSPQVQSFAPDPAAEATTVAVPLPLPRPRLSVARADGAVPLPRPRPTLAAN